MKTLMMVTGVALAAQMSVAFGDEAAVEVKKEEAVSEVAKAEVAKADVEVVIEGNDTMQFDKKEFAVTEGQTVALTFKNVGVIPKVAMGHNLVILKQGTVVPTFAIDCMANGQTTGLPTKEELQQQVVAATKLLGPGEVDTITFTAPAAGTYDYICSFPGHFALMKGVMTVAAK